MAPHIISKQRVHGVKTMAKEDSETYEKVKAQMREEDSTEKKKPREKQIKASRRNWRP